jgi:curli biogenesis system outer membrane secretion channel CsgG
MRLTISRLTLLVGALFSAFWVSGLAAQSIGTARVIKPSAYVRVSPSADSTRVTVLTAGSEVEVVAIEDAWVKVTVPGDMPGISKKGYLSKATVELTLAPKAKDSSPPTSDDRQGLRPETARETASDGCPAKPVLASDDDRPVIAILDFDHTSRLVPWWYSSWDVGRGIAALLVTELVNGRAYRVLERAQLAAIFGEQGLANSSRADPNAKMMACLRRVAGAGYLGFGTVTEFGGLQEQGGFWRSLGSKLPLPTQIWHEKRKAKVALNVRLVDTSTAQVSASVNGEGASQKSGVIIAGISVGQVTATNMDSSEFRSSLLGEATDKAVQQTARQLADRRASLGESAGRTAPEGR